MKTLINLVAALSLVAPAAVAADIALPAPNAQAEATMSVGQALATRHSVRSFTSQQLTLQQLSNLCWAACGTARDDQHITAPTAMNRQEIRLMVFTTQGVYEYDARANVLLERATGDHRRLVAGMPQRSQDFVLQAPVSLVMVADLDKFGRNDEHSRLMTAVDAGNVSQNVNLYCQAAGLATVPRASMDVAGIQQLLGLNANQVPLMNNPVGFEAR